MSIIRNRELSQFGSFIYVENSSQEIAITSGELPYVGIGTTNPQYKLDVLGNINAESFTLNGTPLVNPTLDRWQESGSDIYRPTGNVGIGTSIPSEKLEVSGTVKSARFISEESSLPPFSVNSTAQVGNLNVSFLEGKSAPSGDIVGTTDNQTLTNKQLTSPIISGIGSGLLFEGSSSGIVTLTVSPTASGVLVLPSVSGIATLITPQSVGVITTGMIANGTIKSEDIEVGAGITYGKLSFDSVDGSGITNSDVSTNAAISYSKLNLTNSITSSDIAVGAAITNGQLENSTISGVGLGSDLNTLTFGTYFTGSSYNGSSSVTLGLNAESSDTTGNTIVARSNGGFSVGNISVTSLNSSGVVTANSFYVGSNQVIDSSRNLINVVGGNFSGIVTANSFYVDANQVINNTRNLINVVGANFSGIVTANSFYVGSNQVIDSSRNLINVNNGNFSGIVSDTSGNLRDIPQNSQTTSYTLQISDAGKHISITSGGVTVPAGIFNPGDAITIYNDSATGQTITQGSNVTLRFSGTTLTGNRTILAYGIANILCVSSNAGISTFVIAGVIV